MKLLPELGEFVRNIANSLDPKNKNKSVPKKILLPEEMDEPFYSYSQKLPMQMPS